MRTSDRCSARRWTRYCHVATTSILCVHLATRWTYARVETRRHGVRAPAGPDAGAGAATVARGCPFASKQHSAVRADERVRCLSRRRGTSASRPGLRHVGLAHHGGRPTVRTVGRGDTFAVQSLGDVGEGLAFREHRPDLRPPSIVPVVTPDVGQTNVSGTRCPPADLRIG